MDQEQPISTLSSSNLEDDTSETFSDRQLFYNRTAPRKPRNNRSTQAKAWKKSPKDNPGKALTPADLASANAPKPGPSKERQKGGMRMLTQLLQLHQKTKMVLLRGMLEGE